jgi:hypothetical protein
LLRLSKITTTSLAMNARLCRKNNHLLSRPKQDPLLPRRPLLLLKKR